MTFRYDVAISAVPFEAALVSELCDALKPRLQSTPAWDWQTPAPAEDDADCLRGNRSRIALVLHQRVWRHEDATQGDAELLRDRLERRPGSVFVITLDDAPLPHWLGELPRCDLQAAGIDGVVDFIVQAVEACGGEVQPLPEAVAVATPGWGETPKPYLGQPRALTALRRELDDLAKALTTHLERSRESRPELSYELQMLPNRVVARLADAGLSFSWMPGRNTAVADGQLLVIEWSGVVGPARNGASLKSATPAREQLYHAEAVDAGHWRWRATHENGRAYTSANLAAEWVSAVEMRGERHAPAISR
jgi:hypothetical protein